jgi:hypothetical protein
MARQLVMPLPAELCGSAGTCTELGEAGQTLTHPTSP